jgi:hypothetical protein
LGKEIQKTQSDGRKIGHEAVCIKVSIESPPESPKHSSPYRLELQEQLASDVEEDELKSDNVVPDSNELDVSGDIVTTEISTAVRIETEVAVTGQEEVSGSLHQEMQRAASEQPPSSPLSAYQSSEVRLRSSSPGAEDAVQPASSKISKLFSYLSRETSPSLPGEAKESLADFSAEEKLVHVDNKEPSPDVTSRTLSAEISPNKLVQDEATVVSETHLPFSNTPDPIPSSSRSITDVNKRLPLSLERVQIVRQSPSVSSRKNRYLGAIQQLNKGGIDQETAGPDTEGSARKSFSKSVTANSSRHASEEPSGAGQKREPSDLVTRQQFTISTIEIPDSQVETEGPEVLQQGADRAAETTTTSKAKVGAGSMKRKAAEIEREGSSTAVDIQESQGATARPTKRVRKSGIWKKVAANTGVFALGAVTAVAGLLLWPEED